MSCALVGADLLLAGDGSERQALESLVTSLGVCDRVRFLGVRRDVPALLAASDVFVLPSLSEAASLTLLEAMACAVPSVVTDVGGNPEIVTDGLTGRLVPRGDADVMGQAIRSLLSDPELARRVGLAARAHVEQHYALDDSLAQYLSLYRDLASS